jgi:hypothetical protein
MHSWGAAVDNAGSLQGMACSWELACCVGAVLCHVALFRNGSIIRACPGMCCAEPRPIEPCAVLCCAAGKP